MITVDKDECSFISGYKKIYLGMEEIRGKTHCRVSFKSQHHLPMFTDGKLHNTFRREHKYIGLLEKAPLRCRPGDVLGSPISAMEYLSRSWSPEASNFLQIFSSNNFPLSLGDSCIRQLHEEDREGELEREETRKISTFAYKDYASREELEGGPEESEAESDKSKQRKPQEEKEVSNRVSSLQALIAIDRDQKTYQRNASFPSWLNLKQVKGWLRGTPLTSLMSWHKERRKEELRLRTAKVDAALSVARLAAAIAGITGTNIIGEDNTNYHKNGAMVPCDNNSFGNVVSFAAALVASVCAEAAETAGAPREHVASAINSGFATQTPADIVTVTASAATCLRGAATLRSRAITGAYLQERKELLTSATPLPVLTPSGNKRHRLVSIHIKCHQLLLSLTKKYLGAVLTSREYTILDMMRESRKAHGGYYMLSLQTDGGDIKLLFQNEKQNLIWMSTISNFLQKCNVGQINIR